MSIESFKLSEKAKHQLIQLKRKTGIEHWNVLCRWAFCLSLAEKTIPPDENIITASNIEMTWKTFAGIDETLYMSLLKQRMHSDKLEISKKNIEKYFKLHIHRGISYLANNKNINSCFDLLHIIQ